MSYRKMWFGTPGHMKLIKVPQGGGGHTPVGYAESVQYLSGRKAVRRSLGSHQEYDWTWRGKREEIQHLIDCAAGMYGEAPFYFIDPMWARHNVLPAHWATPSLGAHGAPPIYGERRPVAVPMAGNDGSWPSHGAQLLRNVSVPRVKVYVPIPPGHTFRFWYAGTAGVVRLERMNGNVPSTVTTPTERDPAQSLIAQGSSVLNHSASLDGVNIYLNIPSGTPSAIIYGMRAVVVPTGTPLASLPDGFIGGRGHHGVDFETHPTVTPYSEPYDSVGVTARLIEVDY